VTVGAAEHVLLLGDGALDAGAARHVGVGHVEDGEADAMASREGLRDDAPVFGDHLDAKPRVRRA